MKKMSGQEISEKMNEDKHLLLRSAAVGYNGRALIHGIEIGVRRGEIVTLVGPNGSGKSTILKSITQQLQLVEGEILLASRTIDRYTPAELAKQMAVVLTGRLQTELMTCRDVAAMGRYPYTGRLGILSEKDEEKVDGALEAVHAELLADRPFDEISDGERQRILLARAICQEPEIIVLDEPTSYLDIRHKLELLSILYKMAHEQRITVVMSLHEIELAMRISDRVICVKGEEIFACGRPADILNNDTVRRLYDLDPALGFFDVDAGSLRFRFAEPGGGKKPSVTPAAAASPRFRFAEPGGGKKPSVTPAAAVIPRFMLAAPASGSGKTLITCGLLRLLQRKGLHPVSFKCGPDYIDPMFHRQVLGIPSRNLDTFFSPQGETLSILHRAVLRSQADIAVIEGVMGYFDGTGTTGMEASSFDLAMQTDTPVILVINVKGMSRSVVPVLQGFAAYEKDLVLSAGINSTLRDQTGSIGIWIEQSGDNTSGQGKSRIEQSGDNTSGQGKSQSEQSGNIHQGKIRGVILNRISAAMFPLMKKWIEEDTGLQVIGYLPQNGKVSWGSRHLGLLQPEEVHDLQAQIDMLADTLEETIDIDGLLSLAGFSVRSSNGTRDACRKKDRWKNAEPYKNHTESQADRNNLNGRAGQADRNNLNGRAGQADRNNLNGRAGQADQNNLNGRVRIAVALDEAFRFYYEDNLEMLRECGADLVFFSPIHDRNLPKADGLLLGGGYPELHARELAGNEQIKTGIRACVSDGMPVLAECGGFMYLQEFLELPGETVETAEAGTEESTVRWPMCGVLPGTCRKKDHLVRFGYLELANHTPVFEAARSFPEPTNHTPGERGPDGKGFLPDGQVIRGHEFHYFDSTDNGEACTACKPGRQRSWTCMVVRENLMAGFPHLYYRSNPAFAARFVEKCKEYAGRNVGLSEGCE